MRENTHPKQEKTILIISAGFTLLFLAFKLKWAIAVATLVAMAGLTFPQVGALIVKAWDMLGKFIGAITSRILLTLIFYLVLFPVGLLARLGGRDPLMLKKRDETYFTETNQAFDRAFFEKPW